MHLLFVVVGVDLLEQTVLALLDAEAAEPFAQTGVLEVEADDAVDE